ncbi:hypothetical protein MJL79_29340, partial [Salmonella enterica subsp. enterica serovar Montevideo]|nr:hypothetical protein [Salmonella enterica subsp. enterica serovar Montevideo]
VLNILLVNKARFVAKKFNTQFSLNYELKDSVINPVDAETVFVCWISLRVISQVEQTNTQALLPTMNMARQLSEASAYELFSAQNL